MPDAGRSAGIDEAALGLGHVVARGRNHQHAIDAVERSAKRFRPAHVALDQVDAGQIAQS